MSEIRKERLEILSRLFAECWCDETTKALPIDVTLITQIADFMSSLQDIMTQNALEQAMSGLGAVERAADKVGGERGIGYKAGAKHCKESVQWKLDQAREGIERAIKWSRERD